MTSDPPWIDGPPSFEDEIAAKDAKIAQLTEEVDRLKNMKEIQPPKYLFKHHCPDWDWLLIHEYHPEFLHCTCRLSTDSFGSNEQRETFKEILEKRLIEEAFTILNGGPSNAIPTNSPDPNRRPPAQKDFTQTYPDSEAVDSLERITPSASPLIDKLSRRW